MIKAITYEKKKLDDLTPAEYNPRKILRKGDKGYEKLKASLVEFGEVLPIVWNKQTGHIVGGHQRYFIYQDEGIQEVEVSVVDLPLKKEKALNITLNNERVGSDWDPEKLYDIIQELDDPEFKITGLEAEDLDNLIAQLDELESLDADLNFHVNTDPEEEGDEAKTDEPLKDPEELPYEEPEEKDPPKEVYFKIGKYEFMVDASVYSTWLLDLKNQHGDDHETVIDEIKIRLSL